MGPDGENRGKGAAIDEDGSGDAHHEDVEGQNQSNPKMDLEERPTQPEGLGIVKQAVS
jgi:hypothetical protein